MKKTPETGNHARHSCIPPEQYSFSKWYTFSYSPEDMHAWQDKSLYSNPLKDWLDRYHKLFDMCKNAELKCQPEVSGLGRLHWHGIIHIKNMYFYLKDLQILKLNGTFEIDTISDPMEWNIYCRKQQEIMGPLCQSNNVRYIYQSNYYEGRSDDSFRRS